MRGAGRVGQAMPYLDKPFNVSPEAFDSIFGWRPASGPAPRPSLGHRARAGSRDWLMIGSDRLAEARWCEARPPTPTAAAPGPVPGGLSGRPRARLPPSLPPTQSLPPSLSLARYAPSLPPILPSSLPPSPSPSVPPSLRPSVPPSLCPFVPPSDRPSLPPSPALQGHAGAPQTYPCDST